jgi:hypothetical protein
MAGLIWIIAGVVALGAAAVWVLIRGQSRSNRDLGTISSQWMAERRSHEREAGDR